MIKISFIHSDDRKYNIERCLSLIKSEILSSIEKADRIVVKPNCVNDKVKLASTNFEALDALLGFIKPYARNQIILAEGTATGSTINAFKSFGYLNLQEKYDLEIIDLNHDDSATVELYNSNGKKWKAEIARTILNSDYLISITPPKTHNEVVYTGAIKNVAVGSLIRRISSFSKSINELNNKLGLPKNNKALMHQGNYYINKNIEALYRNLPINLSVIDGYEAMQGNGPVDGEMVPGHYAIASSSAIGADWLACNLMGVDIKDVGYLEMMESQDNEYFVVGDDWKKYVTKFKMPDDFESIRRWQQNSH